MLYKTEFPDYDGEFKCPVGLGFEDSSYHNDVMPRIRKDMQVSGHDVEINIWQDYENPDLREYPDGKRYILQIIVDGDILEEHLTDSWKEIESYLERLDGIVKSILAKNGVVESVLNQVLTGKSLTEAMEYKPAWEVIDIAWLDPDGECVDNADLPDEYVIPAGELSVNASNDDLADWLTNHLAGVYPVNATDFLARPVEESKSVTESEEAKLTPKQLKAIEFWWDEVSENYREALEYESDEMNTGVAALLDGSVAVYCDFSGVDSVRDFEIMDDLSTRGIEVPDDVDISKDAYTGGWKITFSNITPDEFIEKLNA